MRPCSILGSHASQQSGAQALGTLTGEVHPHTGRLFPPSPGSLHCSSLLFALQSSSLQLPCHVWKPWVTMCQRGINSRITLGALFHTSRTQPESNTCSDLKLPHLDMLSCKSNKGQDCGSLQLQLVWTYLAFWQEKQDVLNTYIIII